MPKPHPIKALPSREHLLACFSYDPETGALTWRARPREHFATKRGWNMRNAKFAGKRAGAISNGHRVVDLDDVGYFAHRIIWKMVTGEEPPETIDHRDLNRSNNRWKNLRRADHTGQNGNKGLQKNNTTGRRGVYLREDGRPCVHIVVNGKQRRFGTYNTVAEAGAVADAIRRERDGEFFRET